jgi:hypothetical protein
MPTVYSVIGEHRDNPDRLLALGSDGKHYALTLPSGATAPTEPGDEWAIDSLPPDPEDVVLEEPVP